MTWFQKYLQYRSRAFQDELKLQTQEAELERLRSENGKLNRRLFPGQGEEYANEVERQRYVIESLQEDLKYRNDQYEGLAIRLRRIETLAGRYLDKGELGDEEALRAVLEEEIEG